MPTIRKRGPNRWQIQVYTGRNPGTGRRTFTAKTVTGTKADAVKVATKLQASVDAGRIGPGDDPTVNQLVETWIRLEGAGWSPRTLNGTRQTMDTHLGTLGTVRLSRLRAHHIADHLAALGEAGVGAPTVAKVHSRLRAALSAAVRLDLIATNPAKTVRPPTRATGRAQAATGAQVAAVLALLAGDPEMAAFVRLAAVTGARRGELCALRWDDLTDGSLTIVRGVVDAGPGHGLLVKPLKTDRPKRVTLDQATLEVLARWRTASGEADLQHGRRSPWVFPGVKDRSQPVRPDLVSRRWRTLREDADAGTVRLHDLRHGVGTDAMALGFSPVQAAARLGHARTSTTTDLYGHHAPAGDQALADALGDRLDAAIREKAQRRT